MRIAIRNRNPQSATRSTKAYALAIIFGPIRAQIKSGPDKSGPVRAKSGPEKPFRSGPSQNPVRSVPGWARGPNLAQHFGRTPSSKLKMLPGDAREISFGGLCVKTGFSRFWHFGVGFCPAIDYYSKVRPMFNSKADHQ